MRTRACACAHAYSYMRSCAPRIARATTGVRVRMRALVRSRKQKCALAVCMGKEGVLTYVFVRVADCACTRGD
eukprot:6202692-Pleurochrysis_carterae.AAC.1